MNITIEQLRTLVKIKEARPELEFFEAKIHPYSGVLTVQGDFNTVLIEPDGKVAYSSASKAN